MDTIGSLVDKLITVDMKLWNSQDIVYKIRKMTEDEFINEFCKDVEGMKLFWKELNKATDLNVQRNALIDEIDIKITEMISEVLSGEELDNGKYIQRSHKTY